MSAVGSVGPNEASNEASNEARPEGLRRFGIAAKRPSEARTRGWRNVADGDGLADGFVQPRGRAREREQVAPTRSITARGKSARMAVR